LCDLYFLKVGMREWMLLQVSKGDMSVEDIERLITYGQMLVDVVRRVEQRVCQASHDILQRASTPALVGFMPTNVLRINSFGSRRTRCDHKHHVKS